LRNFHKQKDKKKRQQKINQKKKIKKKNNIKTTMKVIFLENVLHVAKKGEIKEVSS
jgi:hypothetical protein